MPRAHLAEAKQPGAEPSGGELGDLNTQNLRDMGRYGEVRGEIPLLGSEASLTTKASPATSNRSSCTFAPPPPGATDLSGSRPSM